MHFGNGHTLGEKGGEQNHTLSISELPTHTHVLNASNTPAATNIPTGAYLAIVNNAYTAPANLVAMSPASLANQGGSQAHLNIQPFLTLTFCIALTGIFPSQN
jgi:microcystin-dependent protein